MKKLLKKYRCGVLVEFAYYLDHEQPDAGVNAGSRNSGSRRREGCLAVGRPEVTGRKRRSACSVLYVSGSADLFSVRIEFDRSFRHVKIQLRFTTAGNFQKLVFGEKYPNKKHFVEPRPEFFSLINC